MSDQHEELAECDGGCAINELCKGDVKRVVVSASHWRPQGFHYCRGTGRVQP